MGERSTTTAAACDHDLTAVASQKSDRRLVDCRLQHLLGAARQERDTHSPLARACINPRPVCRGGGWNRTRGERECRRQLARKETRQRLGHGCRGGGTGGKGGA